MERKFQTRGSGEEVFATLPATGVVAVSPSHLRPVCCVATIFEVEDRVAVFVPKVKGKMMRQEEAFISHRTEPTTEGW